MNGKKTNFIEGQFESYRKWIKWMEQVYPERKFMLEHRLEGLKPITYDSIANGSYQVDKSNSREAKLADDIITLETRFNLACRVIRFCEENFCKVKEEYQEVITLRYKYGFNVKQISEMTKFEPSTIYKIIERETKRLSEL